MWPFKKPQPEIPHTCDPIPLERTEALLEDILTVLLHKGTMHDEALLERLKCLNQLDQ